MKKSIAYKMTSAVVDIAFNEYSHIIFDMRHPVGFNVSNSSVIEYLKDETVMINYTLNDGMMVFGTRQSKNPNIPQFQVILPLTTFGPSQELIDIITPYSRQSNKESTGQKFHYYSVEKQEVIDEIIDAIFESID